MHSNNETGALMPVREAAAAARAAGALSHTDASQSVGKVEVRGVRARAHTCTHTLPCAYTCTPAH